MSVLLHVARGGHLAAVAMIAGAGVVHRLAGGEASPPVATRNLTVLAGGGCAAAALTLAVLLGAHATEMLDTSRAVLDPYLWLDVAARTWVGHFLLAEVLAIAIIISLIALRVSLSWSALPAAAAFAAIAAASHAGADAEDVRLAGAAVVHIVLAGLWFGCLPALLLLPAAGRTRNADVQVAVFRRFSRIALPAMLLVLASGAMLALWSAGGLAGLLATPYGAVLLAKLAVVAGALACAALIRNHLLPRAEAQPRWRLVLALRVEIACATAAILLAAALAGLPPGAHAEIDWPWSFRVAPSVAWFTESGAATRMVAGAALAASGVLLAAVLLRRRPRGRGLAWLGGACAAAAAAAGIAVGLPATTVAANPATFLHSPLRYEAASVALGADLFQRHCSACHGRGGRGNGPLAAGMQPPPADLIAPHLGYHTHGDLFWWIGHGYPNTPMPAFAAVLDERARWSLVAYLMALSFGYQARVLDHDPVPRDPWLPAIDLPLDQSRDLSDLRGRQPAIVLFVRNEQAAGQADALARALAEGAPGAATVAIVAAPLLAGNPAPAAPPAPDIIRLADTDGTLWRAWSCYRRTLALPGVDDRDAPPALLGIIVDRYGFVRARWRDDDGEPSPTAAVLARTLADLAAEPRLADPDEHGR